MNFDGTTATITSGTVVLNSASSTTVSALGTADSTTGVGAVTVTNGKIGVVYTGEGSATTIISLDAADTFSIGDKEFVYSSLGFIRTVGSDTDTKTQVLLPETKELGDSSIAVSRLLDFKPTDITDKGVVVGADGKVTITFSGTLPVSDTLYANATNGNASATYVLLEVDSTTSGYTYNLASSTNVASLAGISIKPGTDSNVYDMVIGTSLANSEIRITNVDTTNGIGDILINFEASTATSISHISEKESFYYGDKFYLESRLGLLVFDSGTVTLENTTYGDATISSTVVMAKLFSFDNTANDQSTTFVALTTPESLTTVATLSQEDGDPSGTLRLTKDNTASDVTFIDSFTADATTKYAVLDVDGTNLKLQSTTGSSALYQIIIEDDLDVIIDKGLTPTTNNADFTFTTYDSNSSIVLEMDNGAISSVKDILAGDTINNGSTTFTMSNLGLIFDSDTKYYLLNETSTEAATGGIGFDYIIANVADTAADQEIRSVFSDSSSATVTIGSDTVSIKYLNAIDSSASMVYATAEYEDGKGKLTIDDELTESVEIVNIKGVDAELDYRVGAEALINMYASDGSTLKASFKVNTLDNFTVTSETAAQAVTVDDTSATIDLIQGTMAIYEGQSVKVNSSDNKTIEVESGNVEDNEIAYTVTKTGATTENVTITGVAVNSDVKVNVIGLNGSTIQTSQTGIETATYTFGENQVFVITGDNATSDGLLFKVNEYGYVTAIDHLDEGAIIEITKGDYTGANIVINNNTIRFDSDTEITVLGINTGTSSIKLAADEYLIDIQSNTTTAYVYTVSGNAVETQLTGTAKNNVGTYSNTVWKLSNSVLPENHPVIIRGQSSKNGVSLADNSGNVYVSDVTSNIAVKVSGDTLTKEIALQLVQIDDNNTISELDAIPTEGTLTGKYTLQVLASESSDTFTISSGTTVTFGSDASITLTNANGAIVKNAPTDSDVTFILSTTGKVFTINDISYTTKAAGDKVKLTGENTVEITASNTAVGNVFSATNVSSTTEITLIADADSSTKNFYSINGTTYAVVSDTTVANGKVNSGTVELSKASGLPVTVTLSDSTVVTVTAPNTGVVNVTASDGKLKAKTSA